MYAIIQTGGKQYKVAEGDRLRVEKLPGEIGAKVKLDHVLFVAGDDRKIGTPVVSGAEVAAEVVAQDRAAKIIVFKKKRRKGYKKKQGHRQSYTELKITKIKA